MAYRLEIVRRTLISSLDERTEKEAEKWAEGYFNRETQRGEGGIVEEVRLVDDKGNRLRVWKN